jgi:iron-sulfur cluster repair protein YtfE (RIC family)
MTDVHDASTLGDLVAANAAAARILDGFGLDGCASYRSLYERLAALELDTHLHIHKENHVLFPAALRLAEA